MRNWFSRRPLLYLLLVGVIAAGRPAATHAAGLDAALLDIADLPAGWSVLSEAAPTPSSYGWCPAGAMLPVAPIERAVRSFTGGSPGPLLYHEVLGFRPGEGSRALAAVRASPGPCSWSDAREGLAPMTFTLAALEELGLGEEAVRRRLVARWAALVVEAEVVIIRQGDAVALLTHLAVGAGEAWLDAALGEQLMARAAAQLRLGAGAGGLP